MRRLLAVLALTVIMVCASAPWNPAAPQVHAAPGVRPAQVRHGAVPAPDPAAAFAYTSVWYANIYVGDVEHLQLEARDQVKHGIWVFVYFSSSLQYKYYESTDAKGFWSKEFHIPTDSVGAHSAEAVVTFQLWYGDTTAKDFKTFVVLIPPATYEALVATVTNFSVAVGQGNDATAKTYLSDGALSQANATSVLQVLGLPDRPSRYLYNIQSHTDLNASVRMTYYVGNTAYDDQFELTRSGEWYITQITPVT
jgi:hypothetical protein